MITMFWPYVPEEAIKAVSEVLRSRWIGQGPKVDAIEKKFGDSYKKININLEDIIKDLENSC